MAELDIAPQFGAELKDAFKPINAWVGAGIAWLDDIQQFYRERSTIEKEYSAKLNALAKKYFEKKAKRSSALSVGDTPTVTPGSLESASMTTWTLQLSTLESRAAEHDKFAAQLLSGLATPVQHLQNRYEDLRKQHAEYAGKLEKERDGAYADLRKTKGKYDGVCQDVEKGRKKIGDSYDHGKTKARGAFEGQQSDMRNAKNTYLIAINVTNKQKERYYHEYVPDLLDSLQALSESRTNTLNSLWLTAASFESQTLSRSHDLITHLSSEIPRNNPVLDSMMFARHNAPPVWNDPPDFVFEPSPVWLDDDTMAADPGSKTFLMNILTKSKSSLGELKRECEAKRKEVEGAKQVRQAIRNGQDKRDEVEVIRSLLSHQSAYHDASRKLLTAEVSVSTILTSVGDVSVGMSRHTFKNETFRLPTNCDLCGDRIWGLSAKGLSCGECGFTCHTKCELKVPADCPGELTKDQRKAAKAERQAAASAQVVSSPPGSSHGGGGGTNGAPTLQRSDTMGSMNTLSSGYAASAHRSLSGATVTSPTTAESSAPSRISSASTRGANRIVAPPPAAYITSSNGDSADAEEQTGRMLYAYTSTNSAEATIADNTSFTLLEPDDGSGWIKIRPSSGGREGLVPASYAELLPPAVPSKSPFAHMDDVAPRPTPLSSHSTTSLGNGSDTSSITSRKKVGPAVAPRRGAKKQPSGPAVKYVEALYAYEGNGEGETSMREGERLVLVSADTGDGWCEVQGLGGRGVVPSTWVKEA